MAFSLVGNATAAGAGQGLEKILEQKLVREKFAEIQRQALAEEQYRRDSMDQVARENALNRDLTRGEGAAGRALTREEGGATRAHQSSEGGLSRALTASEGAATRGVQTSEGAANRGARATESAEDRALTRSEGAAGRATAIKIAELRQADDNTRATLVRWKDPETGEDFEQYMTPKDAIEFGKHQGMGGKGQAQIRMKYADLIEARRMAKGVLAKGDASQWATIGPAVGRIAKAKSLFNLNTADHEAMRAEIGNLYSLLAHERFGGALTASEIVIAKSFLPSETDGSIALKQKLNGIIDMADGKLKTMGAPTGEAAPPPPGAPPPAAAKPWELLPPD